MPRILALCAALLLGACVFKTDYEGALACSDGKCPAGLMCNTARNLCLAPDAAVAEDARDADADAPDAKLPALTCADPGLLAATGGSATGTTAGRPSRMASSCGGFVNNGPDAVYKIMLPAGRAVTVSITALHAYVIAACTETPPGTPTCLGGSRASAGSPITVNPAAGASYIIVDEEGAAAPGGGYKLDVTVN